MRMDIPKELPRHREPPSGPVAPHPQQPTAVQKHLQALKDRAHASRPQDEPSRRAPSRSPQPDRKPMPPPDARRDPRVTTDPRRVRRDRNPSQAIGMQLRPEERKVLLELGRFRVIRTRDLGDSLYDGKQRKLDEDLAYLRTKGLIETRHINLRRDGTRRQIDRVEVATLTRDGRAWLHKSGEVPAGQAIYSGFVKPREIEHDSLIYRAYRDGAQRIERDGGTNLRVKLDFEIKAAVQKDIHHARKAGPRREMADIKQEVAAKHALPFIDGGIQIPDARIEFDRPTDGVPGHDQDQGSRTGGHEDIEVLTAAYRRGQLRAKAQAGFRAYAAAADRSSITAKIEEEHNMMRDILDL